jgi:fibronectin type 3 domain-containing protein
MKNRINFLTVLILLCGILFFNCETDVSDPKDIASEKTRYSIDIPEEVDADLYRISVIDSSDTITYYEKALEKKIQVTLPSGRESKIVVEAFSNDASIFTAGADIPAFGNGKINLHKIEVTGLQIPGNFSSKITSDNKVSLFWSSVNGASTYKVFRSVTTSENWTVLGEISEIQYTDNSVENGVVYFYKLIAVGNGEQSSETDPIKVTIADVQSAKPQSPSGVVAKAQSQTAILVTWGFVANAESYIVQYASAVDKNFHDIETPLTTVELTGLLSETPYIIRVVAKNTAGQSEASSEITCSTLSQQIVKPAVPFNVKATALSEKSISVTWDNVAGASSYSIMYSTQATGTFTAKTTSVNNYVIESLTALTTYYIKVAAVGGTGSSSEYSDIVSAKTLEPAQLLPSVPTLTATMVSDTSLRISWSAVTGAATYIIERSLTTSGSYTPVCTTSALSFTDIKCQTNTTFYYKGKAVNSAGASQYSTVVSAKTDIKLDAPTGLSQGAVTDTSIGISWDAVPGSSSYKVYSSISSNGTYLESGTSVSTSYIVNKLKASTTYYIKVSSVTGSKESPASSYISATTMASLSVPTGLTATATSATSITVKFNAVTGITRYKLYSSTNNSTFTVLSTLTGTTYTHSGLTANTTYYYKVSSVNDVLESVKSAAVSVKTQAGTTKKAVIQSNCNGCGRCPPVCAPKAITRSGSIYVVDLAKCNGCGKCITACPRGAIKLQ